MTNWTHKDTYIHKQTATKVVNEHKRLGIPAKVVKDPDGYAVLVGYQKAMAAARRYVKSAVKASHKRAYAGIHPKKIR
jgi:hypothetical protein